MLAASCATAPRAAGEDDAVENKLPPGAVGYGFAAAPHLQALIRDLYPALLNDKSAAQFVQQSDSAVFGVYQNAADGENPPSPSYFLVTKGRYPASSYNFALGLSPLWKSEKSATAGGGKWWRYDAIALSIGKTEAFLRVGSPPDAAPDPLAASTRELGAFFDGVKYEAGKDGPAPVFAFYVPSSETAGFIRGLGIPLGITLENITLTVYPDPPASPPYRSALSLKTKSPSEAKALTAILSLARATIGKRLPPDGTLAAGLLFASPPAFDGGSTVTITGTFPLDALLRSLSAR
jgi:hypothetical protein